MAKTKITIKSGNKTYVSVDIPGNPNKPHSYILGEVFNYKNMENFNAFHGTSEEWDIVLNESTEFKIQNIGQ